MKALSLAWRLLRRDLRAGELRLLAIALVVAVASVSAVGFFTDRIERAMERQASQVLAADLVLESGQPFASELFVEATARGLASARTLGFPSVIMSGGQPQLVQVKAVSEGYPLRGELRTRPRPELPDAPATAIPAPGEAWIEGRLLVALGLQPGDEIRLGSRGFRVSQLLTHEPDRAANLFRLAPRVLIRLDEVDSTGLLGPASRVRHRLLVAGPSAAVATYRESVKPTLAQGVRVLDVRGARPELRTALDRGGRFLRLTAVTAILLCVVAVALSTRRFVERQADTSALLRCLGASRRLVAQVFLLRLLMLGLSAGLVGSLLGLAAQTLLVELVGRWFANDIPPPSSTPLFSGLLTGLLVLMGFALPSVLRLSRVPPLRVFRRHLGAPPLGYALALLAAVASLAALMVWQIGDDRLAVRLIGGLLIAVLLLVGAARLLVRLLAPLRSRLGGAWRYGLASLSRNPLTTSLQLTGFGLGITALLLLALVRVDLLNSWRSSLPEDTPNHFLINIQPDEVAGVRELLDEAGLKSGGPFPMVRGRLLEIAGQPVKPERYPDPRAQRLAAREFNLSASAEPQADNKILAGHWWTPEERELPLWSVEEGIAESLGIRLGDELLFDVAGQPLRGRVSNLRSVQWDSFNVNFFVVGTPGMMAGQPATYITSFHLPRERQALLRELVERYPSVTPLDVSALIQQVRDIMDQGALAIESVFLFTLAAGVLVLIAGIQASRELRVQEAAVLRTLGLRRRQLLLATVLEFGVLGALAGIISALVSTAISYSLASAVFQLPWHFDPGLWLVAVFGGALGVGLAGVAASWPLIHQPPLVVLRRV